MSTLDSSTIKARNNLLTLFAILTILDLVLVVVSRDLWAIGRILITIAVMYFVIQGHKWARVDFNWNFKSSRGVIASFSNRALF